MGVTFASFQTDGKFPCWRERLKTRASDLGSFGAPSFKRRGLIWSGPLDFVTFRFDKASVTSCSVTVIVSSMCCAGGKWGSCLLLSLIVCCEAKYSFNMFAFWRSIS